MKIEVSEQQHKELQLLVRGEIARLKLDSIARIDPEGVGRKVALLEMLGEDLAKEGR
jgi:hypothetical protein